jgi:2-keto-4-pentenoate hydratase/2-oxohepta-3-ene-1,7-dioic acid hydratase in catechol pathway
VKIPINEAEDYISEWFIKWSARDIQNGNMPPAFLAKNFASSISP